MNCTLLLAAAAACLWSAAVAGQAPTKPDLGKARDLATQVCAACHGADGNSTAPINPSIAGQPADYITLQLANFKSGVRDNAVMKGMVAALSPEDMKALGVYFSQQKPKPRTAKDAALVLAGQKLYRAGDPATGVPACSACHSPDGAGIPKSYPRLAGQYAEYTYAQLTAFWKGDRGNDKDGKDTNGRIMAAVAARMSDAQMKAVAEYASGLR